MPVPAEPGLWRGLRELFAHSPRRAGVSSHFRARLDVRRRVGRARRNRCGPAVSFLARGPGQNRPHLLLQRCSRLPER